MTVTFVKGDLFRHPGLEGLAHGCNCAGAMGKGIATEFRDRYPRMYAEYKQRCADGRFRLGDVFDWKEGGVTVFNLGTQKTWRTKAELSAIEGGPGWPRVGGRPCRARATGPGHPGRARGLQEYAPQAD